MPKFRSVAVVGSGVIAASWGVHFVSSGLRVVAPEAAEGAEERLRGTLVDRWSWLAGQGRAPEDVLELLWFEPDGHASVRDVDLVQGNGPERLGI